jgi:hypothetical protein
MPWSMYSRKHLVSCFPFVALAVLQGCHCVSSEMSHEEPLLKVAIIMKYGDLAQGERF